MSREMVPTMRLRFVEREGGAPFTPHTMIGGPPEKRIYRVLQQWFEQDWRDDFEEGMPITGEWRDVPVEKP